MNKVKKKSKPTWGTEVQTNKQTSKQINARTQSTMGKHNQKD